MDVENVSKEGDLASGQNSQGVTVKVQAEKERDGASAGQQQWEQKGKDSCVMCSAG